MRERRGRKPRTKVECGSHAGYERHRRNGEPACDACKAAHSKYVIARRQARRADELYGPDPLADYFEQNHGL